MAIFASEKFILSRQNAGHCGSKMDVISTGGYRAVSPAIKLPNAWFDGENEA